MYKGKQQVALVSVFAAILLTSFKFIVAILTGSLGILSEALHSGLDLVAAVITYFSVRISDKPPDTSHHYGHGKIENLSALIETILLLITCAWIIYEACERLLSGNTHIEVTVWSYVVVVSSIIIDVNRSRMLYKAAKLHRSQALEADALHFSTDIWSSAVVLFGLVCANFGFFFADAVAALVVALIVLFISYRLGRRAVDVLLDKAPADIAPRVTDELMKFPEVRAFHSLKIRTSGPLTFIKLNIHFPPEITLQHVHDLCNEIERDLSNIIPGCSVFIHPEPHNPDHITQDDNLKP